MKPILLAAVTIVHLALFSYTIAIITQTRKKNFTQPVMTFLLLGVIFDIVSTICMVISSGNGLTVHGFIGYSSLTGMLSDTIASFLRVRKYGMGSSVPEKFNRWSLIAYGYWVCAYITGALIIMFR